MSRPRNDFDERNGVWSVFLFWAVLSFCFPGLRIALDGDIVARVAGGGEIDVSRWPLMVMNDLST